MLTDDKLRRLADFPAAGYATQHSMARELLAARKVIAAARQNCPAFDGPPCPCLVCAALRDYDEATR